MDALDLPAYPSVSRRIGAAERLLRFSLLTLLLVAASLSGSWCLVQLIEPTCEAAAIPLAFVLAAGCLSLVSFAFFRAVQEVRRERQRRYRRWLLVAVGGCVLFASLQSFGLYGILPPDRDLMQQTSGLNAFLIAVVTMHGLIVAGAFLLTSRVVVETFADRYDHEYYVGVQACAMLWYGLGITWLLVLMVLAVAG